MEGTEFSFRITRNNAILMCSSGPDVHFRINHFDLSVFLLGVFDCVVIALDISITGI